MHVNGGEEVEFYILVKEQYSVNPSGFQDPEPDLCTREPYCQGQDQNRFHGRQSDLDRVRERLHENDIVW